MKKPKGWRKGQTIFNFLEWLKQTTNISTTQNIRMADPFHVSDKEWDELWNKFLKENNAKM